MRRLLRWGIAILIALAGSATAGAQANPLPPKPYGERETLLIYEKLLKQINRVPIYDDHSHATFPDDSDMDAMASPPDASTVLRLRDTNPESAVHEARKRE